MKHTEGKVHTFKDGDCIQIATRDKTIIKVWDYPEVAPNAERIAALWNAADGMTTEQAVKYIEHGAEMENTLKTLLKYYNEGEVGYRWITETLAKMEAK